MCTRASGSEWVDPEDPTVIAETELLGAAASIEAAAKKLEQLKPRAKPKVGDYMTNNSLWDFVSVWRCERGHNYITTKLFLKEL